MAQYRSRIDIWLVVLVFAPFIYAIAQGIRDKDYEVLYIAVPIMLLIVSLYWQIKYEIADDHLKIKSGIFGSTRVLVSQIKSVHKTYNPLSAPALSIQRLEVKYGKFDYLLISPQNKEAFVQELKTINPNIDIKI